MNQATSHESVGYLSATSSPIDRVQNTRWVVWIVAVQAIALVVPVAGCGLQHFANSSDWLTYNDYRHRQRYRRANTNDHRHPHAQFELVCKRRQHRRNATSRRRDLSNLEIN